jgi:TolB-like protein
MASFWAEIRRRNVFKVAAAYAIVAWLLIQVASVVAPALSLPSWVTSLVVFLLLLGFPVALVLAWAYEVTPEGIKRTNDIADVERGTQMRGQRLNYVVTGLLALAVAYLLIEDRLPGRAELAVVEAGAAGDDAVSSDTEGPSSADASAVLPNSIAVLPFANLSSDPADEYFALGLHEELLNQLVKLSELTVISRTTMMQYADGTKTPQQVAQERNVQSVMEGSVRRAGDNLRVTVQLIDPATDTHLWSETYDGVADVANIFAIQGNIATNVASALKARLSVKEQSRLALVPTASNEAYGHYLAGIAADQSGTPEASAQSIAELRRAVEIDPSFALAWAQLGYILSVAPTWEPNRTVEYQDAALDAALKALALKPDLPEAHRTLSFAATVRGDWLRSESEYRAAIASGATRAELPERGTLELAVGHIEEARNTLGSNRAVDPVNSAGLAFFVAANEILGDADSVRAYYEQGRQFMPSWPFGEYLMNYIRLGRGEVDALVHDTEVAPRFHAEFGDHTSADAGLAAVQTWYDGLEHATHNDHMIAAAWAAHYGNVELALTAAGRGAQTRRHNIWLLWLPLFDDVRRSPGFEALVANIGLVEYWKQYGWPSFCRPVDTADFECS